MHRLFRAARPTATLTLLLAMAAVPAAAQVSGNVALTSDYVFRGVSQTNEDPAIQGGLDYENDNGFSFGVWGSNVEFGTAAQVEFDAYLGFSKELSNGFTWQVGAIHYDYPGETEINFEEIYAGFGIGFFGIKVSFGDDFLGTKGSGTYIEANLDWELDNGFGFGLHGGQSSFDTAVGIEDYIDYKAYISASAAGLGFELAVTDTDTDQFGDAGDARAVFTISKSM